jgi:hypothetical protein
MQITLYALRVLFCLIVLGHGYAKQHAAPAKHMLGAGLARAPS